MVCTVASYSRTARGYHCSPFLCSLFAVNVGTCTIVMVSASASPAGSAQALCAACEHGQSDCVQQLLTASAAVDQLDEHGATPLYTACNHGESDCVQLLLAANAAIDQPYKDGATPLFAACNQGESDCVQLLLAANAAIDQPSNGGVTPLCTACSQAKASRTVCSCCWLSTLPSTSQARTVSRRFTSPATKASRTA